MARSDSLKKIIPTYFAAFNYQQFSFAGKLYLPRPLRVSPHLARGLGCPAMCGGCCASVFFLDYIPAEGRPMVETGMNFIERTAFVNGKNFSVLSEMQTGNDNRHCKNLNMADGRCGIHGLHPFSCDFEIIRLKHFNDLTQPNQVLTAPYGRAWNMLRIDYERGAMCTIEGATQEHANESIRKLRRLEQWMDYFEIPHKIEPAIKYLEEGEWQSGQPLIIN